MVASRHPWEPGSLSCRNTHLHISIILFLTASLALGESTSFAQGSSCVVDPRVFDYGPHRDDPEAEQLAMTVSGELRAPDSEYSRIQGDLALIRGQHPLLLTVIDDPDYAPNQLIVSLLGAGPWPDYQNLNGYYQAVSDQILFGQVHVLTFCDTINAPVLAGIYAQSPDVDYAEPNSMIGNDDFIVVTVNGSTHQYFIEDGYQDCFDGCDCRRRWTFDVTAGGDVILLSYSEFDALGFCTFMPGACCTGGGVCSMGQAESCLQAGRTPRGPTIDCDADADDDGLDHACGDRCPADPAKTAPGACGCGHPDTDYTGDGVPDCITVPAASTWGMIAMFLGVLAAGTIAVQREALPSKQK